MIKYAVHILFLILVGICWTPAEAQFVNLQIRVEPELSAEVQQELDFGTQITNSGRSQIGLGDVNMGIFSIRAYYTQNVYLNLTFPDALIHSNPAIDQEIPMELSISYNNSGLNRPSESTPLPSEGGLVAIHENTTNLTSTSDIWKEMYIYVYGYIDIGNIPNGEYTGDIVLTVDYD
ncbi:hypothetical protein [Gracilimonas mengyeensis]|uniref:Uncharacterized protein n=1 Tax=Gracilimonas mengyeensis TaxID=1302730 RepID=A0A521EDU8_9BACT|nr:hypothetical protein [Gracilimonas mengyeensis]SMO82094.1 hypothetical protein SAMN06265219_111132 [Gracilimonas mengyeensis]